jgi:hypothetical protein
MVALKLCTRLYGELQVVRIIVKRFPKRRTLLQDNLYLHIMNGISNSISAGTGSLRGRSSVVGASLGLSTVTAWFTQKGALIGAGTGRSIVGIVTRQIVNAVSTITLISEYESDI